VRRRGTSSRYLPRHPSAAHPGTRVPPNTRREHGKKFLSSRRKIGAEAENDLRPIEPSRCQYPAALPRHQAGEASNPSGHGFLYRDCTLGTSPEGSQDRVPVPTSQSGVLRGRRGEGCQDAGVFRRLGTFLRIVLARHSAYAASFPFGRNPIVSPPSSFSFVD
jgi:hypothetical protein